MNGTRSQSLNFDDIRDRLKGVVQVADGWKALCPAHNDTNPSLSINCTSDGKVLLRCFADCDTRDIVKAMGLTMRDLFTQGRGKPQKAAPVTRKPKAKRIWPNLKVFAASLQETLGKPKSRSVYTDFNDKPHMAIVQFDTGKKKTFRSLHRNGEGWSAGDPPGKLPLYRLPTLKEANRVYVCEGEKCVRCACKLGLIATTSAHGSSSAHKTNWSPLAGKDIVILPDNDKPGRKYANAVARNLKGLNPAPCIKVVELPNLPEGGDIVDYVERLPEDTDTKVAIEAMADEAEPKEGEVMPDESIGGIDAVCVSDVVSEDVEWLWPGRIAIGKVTLLIGDPGLGKSFVSLDIAAHVSTGMPWPDREGEERDPGSIILLNAEDGLADTVRPRLEWAKANVTRIHAVRGVYQPEHKDETDLFSLERDLRHLETMIWKLSDCQLIIFDPLNVFLGSKVDSHKDADVRRVIAPLAALATEHNVAVLAIAHLNKADKLAAIYRTMGSIGLAAAARAVWLIASHKDNPKERVFVQVKNNLAPSPGGLLFRIAAPGVIAWSGVSLTMTADEALSPNTPRARKASDAAVDFLRPMLRVGPRWSNDIFEEAKNAGIKRDTLQTAKKRIGAVAHYVPTGTKRRWYWALENDHSVPDNHS